MHWPDAKDLVIDRPNFHHLPRIFVALRVRVLHSPVFSPLRAGRPRPARFGTVLASMSSVQSV
jgi:hypothetical protein